MAVFYLESDGKRIIEDDYWQLRRLQASIVKKLGFRHGELLEALQKPAVDTYARKLRRHYFSRSKDLEIYGNILDLYRIYLLLSPIIQRQPYSMRIDAHRGHALTWMRGYANSKVGRFWYDYWSEPRELDYDRLRTNLIRAGVTDRPFLDHLEEPFFTSYTRPTWEGDLARLIFDPFMFLQTRERGSALLRIGSVIHRLEKSRFPGAIDLRERPGEFWDYSVQYNRVKKETTPGKTLMSGVVDIWISERRINELKTELSEILASKNVPRFKVGKMVAACTGFIEETKYAKSAFDQILGLRRWITEKTKKLKATEKSAGKVGEALAAEWCKKQTFSKAWRSQRNFFFVPDTRKPPATVFMQFFNPKREAINGEKRQTVALVAVGERLAPARKKTAGRDLRTARAAVRGANLPLARARRLEGR